MTPTLANAEALCDWVRRTYPGARVAPGQVTGDGEGNHTAEVMCTPRDCPNCGTEVIAMRRPAELEGRWYALGGHERKPNGWSRITYRRHNRARCAEAQRVASTRLTVVGPPR